MSLAFPKSPCDEGGYHIVNIVNKLTLCKFKFKYAVYTPELLKWTGTYVFVVNFSSGLGQSLLSVANKSLHENNSKPFRLLS
jgi:hypothetical protein